MNKYFVYDPENNEFFTLATKEEQAIEAKKVIQSYLENGEWSEETEGIICGIITHSAQKCNIVNRPNETELDSSGCDEEGVYWSGWEYMCDYEMKEI